MKNIHIKVNRNRSTGNLSKIGQKKKCQKDNKEEECIIKQYRSKFEIPLQNVPRSKHHFTAFKK